MKIVRTPANGEDAIVINDSATTLAEAVVEAKKLEDPSTLTIVDGKNIYDSAGNLKRVQNAEVQDDAMDAPKLSVLLSIISLPGKKYGWVWKRNGDDVVLRSNPFKSRESARYNLVAVTRAVMNQHGKIVDNNKVPGMAFVKSSNGYVVLDSHKRQDIESFITYLLARPGVLYAVDRTQGTSRTVVQIKPRIRKD